MSFEKGGGSQFSVEFHKEDRFFLRSTLVSRLRLKKNRGLSGRNDFQSSLTKGEKKRHKKSPETCTFCCKEVAKFLNKLSDAT